MRASVGTLILSLAIGASASPQQNPDRPAGLDDESTKIIKQLTKTIEDAKNFSVEIQNKTHFVGEGREMRMGRTHKLTVEKPFKISLVQTAGDPDVSVAWDGITGYWIYPSAKGPVYAKLPHPRPDYMDSLSSFWFVTYGRVTDDDRIMPVLLSQNPTEEFLSAYSVRHVGEEEVEGVKCHKLEQMLEEAGGWHILVSQTTPVVIRELRVILEGKSTMSTFYRNWTFDADLPKDQFTLAKPEGAISPEEAGMTKGKGKGKSKKGSKTKGKDQGPTHSPPFSHTRRTGAHSMTCHPSRPDPGQRTSRAIRATGTGIIRGKRHGANGG